MKKMYFYFFLALAFVLTGCAPMLTIKTGDFLDSPTGVETNFMPVKADGKEIITRGTEKTVVRSGFKVKNTKLVGVDSISISKSNVQITIWIFDISHNFFGKN